MLSRQYDFMNKYIAETKLCLPCCFGHKILKESGVLLSPNMQNTVQNMIFLNINHSRKKAIIMYNSDNIQ